MKTCSIEGCGKPHKARGWCSTHYLRWHQTAHPDRYAKYSRQRHQKFPELTQENNQRRIYVGSIYLGRCGFTQTEREAILSGTSV